MSLAVIAVIVAVILSAAAAVWRRSRRSRRADRAAIDEARAAENCRPYVRIDVHPMSRDR
jgi:hypothetical protein